MLNERDIEALRNSYADLARGDSHAAMAVLHPDAEWRESGELPGIDVLHGRKEIERFLAAFLESWSEFHQEVEQVEVAGDRAALIIYLRAVGRESGVPVETRYAHIWTLRDGMGILVEAYRDPDEALTALRERAKP